MLGIVTPVGTNSADPLRDVAAADAFWQKVPRTDAVAAQKAVSGALADFVARGTPNISRLRALLTLDQRARKLVDALLVNYGAGDAESPALEKPYWQSAFELCRSFGQAHGYLLRSMRDSLLYRGWHEYLPFLLLRFFQHRQTELLLRPFVNELSTRFEWKELHETYQYAHSRALLRRPLPISRCRSSSKTETTVEQEYIYVLLQELLNAGQFSPHDAFWASRGIPQWVRGLTLDSRQDHGTEHRFVVDLDGDAGLARVSPESAGMSLYLDTRRVVESISAAIASLRDAPDPAHAAPVPSRDRQLKVLRKLDVLFAPKPPLIARRGERKPIALAVEIVMGLAQVVRALRKQPTGATTVLPLVVPEIEEITITEFGGFTATPTTGLFNDGTTLSPRSTGDPDAGYPLWKLADRSASGCRLQGQIFGSNRVTPGTLIAFRDGAASPWTLAVIRRVEKRPGSRADIGVEYVGTDPRGVKVLAVPGPGATAAGSRDSARGPFAALYLPESARQPVMPLKTLVLPAHAFAPNDRLTLRSATAVYTIHLKNPLEEQGDFVWSPFEVVDCKPIAEMAVAGAASAA